MKLLMNVYYNHNHNGTNRIYHGSQMYTDESKPESKRIMPKTRLTEFPALSVDPRVGISRTALETKRPMIYYFITCDIICYYLSFVISFFFLQYTSHNDPPQTSFGDFHGDITNEI